MKLALAAMMFLTGVKMLFAELALTVLMLLTEFALAVLIFLHETGCCCVDVSY